MNQKKKKIENIDLLYHTGAYMDTSVEHGVGEERKGGPIRILSSCPLSLSLCPDRQSLKLHDLELGHCDVDARVWCSSHTHTHNRKDGKKRTTTN